MSGQKGLASNPGLLEFKAQSSTAFRTVDNLCQGSRRGVELDIDAKA